MPFYEYQCKACGAHHEAMQKISDPPLKKCPECGKSQLQKLISAPVFRLKGGGWYETDFKSDQETKRNLVGEDKGDSSESKPDAKSESKSDVKPEAKGEAKSVASGDAKPAVKPPKLSKPAKAPAKAAARKPSAKPARKAARRR